MGNEPHATDTKAITVICDTARPVPVAFVASSDDIVKLSRAVANLGQTRRWTEDTQWGKLVQARTGLIFFDEMLLMTCTGEQWAQLLLMEGGNGFVGHKVAVPPMPGEAYCRPPSGFDYNGKRIELGWGELTGTAKELAKGLHLPANTQAQKSKGSK